MVLENEASGNHLHNRYKRKSRLADLKSPNAPDNGRQQHFCCTRAHNLHLIMLFSEDNRIRGWFWTPRALESDVSGTRFPCGISVLCPQCCSNFNLKRSLKKPPNAGADLTADLSHWNESDVCGPVCLSQIPESTKTKICLFSRQRLSRVADYANV